MPTAFIAIGISNEDSVTMRAEVKVFFNQDILDDFMQPCLGARYLQKMRQYSLTPDCPLRSVFP